MTRMATKKRRREPRLLPPIDEFERPYPGFIGPVGPPLERWLAARNAERDREAAANLSSETDAGDEVHRPGESEAGE
jgi:hypothetical protein